MYECFVVCMYVNHVCAQGMVLYHHVELGVNPGPLQERVFLTAEPFVQVPSKSSSWISRGRQSDLKDGQHQRVTWSLEQCKEVRKQRASIHQSLLRGHRCNVGSSFMLPIWWLPHHNDCTCKVWVKINTSSLKLDREMHLIPEKWKLG